MGRNCGKIRGKSTIPRAGDVVQIVSNEGEQRITVKAALLRALISVSQLRALHKTHHNPPARPRASSAATRSGFRALLIGLIASPNSVPPRGETRREGGGDTSSDSSSVVPRLDVKFRSWVFADAQVQSTADELRHHP